MPEVDEVRHFVVDVELARSDLSTLLQIVSALHRRQVPVVEASFDARGTGTRFVATVELSARRAHTLQHTLRAIVGVTESRIDITRLSPAVTAA